MNCNVNKKILILSNHHSYTYNFRKEVIQRLLDEGYEVHINLPYGDKVKLLEEMGCIFTESPLDRRGMNPVTDFKLMRSYYRIIRRIKPDVVLSYTIKPNIYGGIICRVLNIPLIANVTGLGTAVGNESILRKVLVTLYKSAFKKAECIFFQNESNKEFFVNHGISLRRYKVIPGSGINTDEFSYQEYPKDDNILRFLFIGRIMKDKGIEELIEAAKRVKEEYMNVQFDALGFCEDEYKDKVEILQEKKIITFHGVKDTVREYLKSCHAVIHPTYHEGMSNVLLEAAATGRPVLASNIPGCKEIFDEGVSGFGFEPKNIDSLTQAIHKFVKLSNDERIMMGKAGRYKVEREFDRSIVVNAYLEEIYRTLED
jgi:galacturonosyltransferase